MIQDSGPFYVYAIHRPSGVPCYVGKGQGDRYLQHARGTHNRHLANIYKQNDGVLPVSMVWTGLTEADAMALEVETIGLIGRICHGGTLVNQTDGGEGVSGLRHSAETRKRIGEIGKGRKHTPETRARMSASRMGREVSPATRAKIGTRHKGKEIPAEMRARISEKLKGKGPPLEHIERLRRINTGNTYCAGRKHTGETKAKIAAAQRGAKRSPEQCAKMALTWTGRKHSAESRAKMSASAKARRDRASPKGEQGS